MCDLGLQWYGCTGPPGLGAHLKQVPTLWWLSPVPSAGCRALPHGLPVVAPEQSAPHTIALSFLLISNSSRQQLSLLSNKSTWDPIRINPKVVENKISGPSSDQRHQRPRALRRGQLVLVNGTWVWSLRGVSGLKGSDGKYFQMRKQHYLRRFCWLRFSESKTTKTVSMPLLLSWLLLELNEEWQWSMGEWHLGWTRLGMYKDQGGWY